jgi:hypothetical protein
VDFAIHTEQVNYYLMLDILFGRRKRSKISPLFFILGGLMFLMACPMVIFGVPFSFMRSIELSALPHPEPTELYSMSAGTKVLAVAQVPRNMKTEPHGLALFYVEKRTKSSQNDSKNNSTWLPETPPPTQVDLQLTDGNIISVNLPSHTTFLNAERFEAPTNQLRYTGYRPGQTLAIEGNWEGNNLLTARTLYAGSPEDYQNYQANQPWFMLLAGIICGGVGIGLLIAGVFLKVLGR